VSFNGSVLIRKTTRYFSKIFAFAYKFLKENMTVYCYNPLKVKNTDKSAQCRLTNRKRNSPEYLRNSVESWWYWWYIIIILVIISLILWIYSLQNMAINAENVKIMIVSYIFRAFEDKRPEGAKWIWPEWTFSSEVFWNN